MARIKELTGGIGADSVLECVGTQESMMQAISSARKGGYVGYVGVPHGVELDGEKLFYAHVHLHGGPRQCVATCPISSGWCGTKRSIPARCST